MNKAALVGCVSVICWWKTSQIRFLKFQRSFCRSLIANQVSFYLAAGEEEGLNFFQSKRNCRLITYGKG